MENVKKFTLALDVDQPRSVDLGTPVLRPSSSGLQGQDGLNY